MPIELKENTVYRRRNGDYCGPLSPPEHGNDVWGAPDNVGYMSNGIPAFAIGETPFDLVEEHGPVTQAVGVGKRSEAGFAKLFGGGASAGADRQRITHGTPGHFRLREGGVYRDRLGSQRGPVWLVGGDAKLFIDRPTGLCWTENGIFASMSGSYSSLDLVEEVPVAQFKAEETLTGDDGGDHEQPIEPAPEADHDVERLYVIVRETLPAMTFDEAKSTVLAQNLVGARICEVVMVAKSEIVFANPSE